jgi:hypothetical protein
MPIFRRPSAAPAALFGLSLLALGPLALLPGCGRSDKSEAAAKLAAKLQACELFPEDLARTASHESVARMTSTLEDGGKPDPGQCVYNSGTLEKPRILSLLVRTFNDAESSKRVEVDSGVYLARLAGRPILHIQDIGDSAVWAGGKVQQLHLRRGPVQMIITVQSPDGSEQLAEARAIAASALTRLDPILQADALAAQAAQAEQTAPKPKS